MRRIIRARARARQWPLWDAPRPRRDGGRGIRLRRLPVPDVLEGILNPARTFIPDEADRAGRREEILSIQAAGLARRVEHTRTRTHARTRTQARGREHERTHTHTRAGILFHVEHRKNRVPRGTPRKNARRNTLQNQCVINGVKKN